MNLDDPKLTAYALGELSDEERSQIEKMLADWPEGQRQIDETQEIAGLLGAEYASESATVLPANLIDIRDDPWFWSVARPLSIAAVIALVAVIGVIAVGTYRHRQASEKSGTIAASGENEPLIVENSPPGGELEKKQFSEVTAEEEPPVTPAAPSVATAESSQASQPLDLAIQRNEAGVTAGSAVPTVRQGEFRGAAKAAGRARAFGGTSIAGTRSFLAQAAPPATPPLIEYGAAIRGIREPSGEFNTAAYDHILENPFLDAATNPLSTFSIDVDTASYSNARRFINEGSLPPKDAVRVEEMINYFTYDYPQPTGNEPFSINLDVAGCPWESSHRLVRIGLKGREIANDKRGPTNLVFLLDVSGSMMPPERLPLIKQAMRLLVNKLTENDRVAVVVYAGASGLALPSTTGDHKEQILSAIESLEAGGSTNGAEGIELAYKIAADNFIKGGVNRVILATDGDFNVGVTSQGDLIRLIEQKTKTGVFLSVLGVGTDNLKDSTMQKLADKGNGNYAYLDSIDEARKVLVQQMNGTLVTIAKDVKIQVEFNPAQVASYRLIGYEKRLLRKEDFNNDKVDAGEIGAGHTVTALYEVVPAGAPANPAASVPPVDPLKYQPAETRPAATAGRQSGSNEMLTVKLRYKKPDGDKSQLIERALTDNGAGFEKATTDLKFAAAVAEFGMILRDSEFKGNGTLGAVLEWAQEAKGSDANGYRSGFIDLVRKAGTLKKS